MTNISGRVAAMLCAGGLAVAVPEAAAEAAIAPAARVAEPPARCLSGVRSVQGTFRHTPAHRLYTVQAVWIPFTTSGSITCHGNGGSAS
ncbi:hypothetical protein AB0M80_35620 [Amycolatopsis sp. NPDC051045]|uniref:hypothetical protein n=1 Tax=Amycolatopsis sp. NPDC051045 TaxID=3156922 RepID=UPI00342C01C1